MTIEISLVKALLSADNVKEHKVGLSHPMEIYEIAVSSNTATTIEFIIRDSQDPLSGIPRDANGYNINIKPNQFLGSQRIGSSNVFLFKDFDPIIIHDTLAIDIGVSNNATVSLHMLARLLKKDDEGISSQLIRDLLEEQTQVGKPQIHFDEATGTYLDQDGNTVDFSDQEQILSRSVRQISRSEQ